jgi:hypothetical protein
LAQAILESLDGYFSLPKDTRMPTGLKSNLIKVFERRPRPTVQEVLTGGPQAPTINDASRAGLSIQATEAAQYSAGLEQQAAVKDATAQAERERDAAIWARIEARRALTVNL